MKRMLVSDLHFGSNQNSEQFLLSQINFFRNQVIPEMKKRDIRHLDVLGDTFHQKELIDNRVKKEVLELFSVDLKEFEIRILIGNHDSYYRDNLDTHSLHFLEVYDNITIINKPTMICDDGVNQMYYPWVTDTSKIFDVMKSDIETHKPQVILGHFEMNAFPLNKIHESTKGLSLTEMPTEGVKYIFSGHYHTPSRKQIGKGFFVYLGSPYQHTRIDENDKKGMYVFDTETMDYEKIDSVDIVMFKTIQYGSEVSPEDITDNVINIMTPYKMKGSVKLDGYISTIKELKPFRYDIKYVTEDEGELPSIEERMKESTNSDGSYKTALDMIVEYIESSQPDEKIRALMIESQTKYFTEASESLLESDENEGSK